MRSYVLLIGILCCALSFSSFSQSVYGKDRDIIKQSARFIQEGKELFDRKDYYGAVEKWTEALKGDPWNNEAKLLIEKTLLIIEELTEKTNNGFELLEGGQLDKAFENFVSVKDSINPGSRSLYGLVVNGFNAIEAKKNQERYLKIVELGDLYVGKGNLEGAEMAYTFARKFDPEDGLVGERVDALKVKKIKRYAADLFDKGAYGESKEEWTRVLELDPGDEDAPIYLSKIAFKEAEKERLDALGKSYFDNGAAFFKRGQFQEAIDQFENAIAMSYRTEESKRYIERCREKIAEGERRENDKNTEQVAYYLREGIKFFNLAQYKKALAMLNEGLKLEPENTQIREYMLRVIIALKREEEKDVPPTSPFFKLIQDLKRLGTEAFERSDYPASVKYWEEILLIFPFNEEARLNLTKALSKSDPALAKEILQNMYAEARDFSQRNKKREAVIKLKLILDVDPGFKDAQAFLRELEAEKKAEEKQEKKVPSKEEKKRAQEFYAKGLEFYRMEKLEEAAGAWAKAVELDPEFVDARVYLSRAESKLRNLAKASGGATAGNDGMNDELRIKIKKHYLDGVNYFMNGMYREAITEWEAVLKLDPKNGTARQNIERARKRIEFGTEQGSS